LVSLNVCLSQARFQSSYTVYKLYTLVWATCIKIFKKGTRFSLLEAR
jgi:hypothetical protein